MRRRKGMVSSAGLTGDATRGNGKTGNRTERECTVIRRGPRGLASGPMAEKLDGFSD